MGTGGWNWYDVDGDGRMQPGEFQADVVRGYQGSCWLDASGGVWRNLRQADGICYSALERMLPDGRPVFAEVRRFQAPAPLKAVERLAYDADADALYATGFTAERPALGDDGRWGGSELVRVDGWLRGSRTLRWQVPIPYAVQSDTAASGFTIAAGAVFVGAQRIREVMALDAETGRSWGMLPNFDERPAVTTGWTWAGLHARLLAPKSYLVTAADRGGWISWRWSPPE